MKEFAKWFYKSKIWQRCRDAYYAFRFGICERCGGTGLIVHHKIELTPSNIHDSNITLNWDNLELLCQTCHNIEHHGSGEGLVREGLMFDGDGNLIQIPPIKMGYAI